MAERSTPKIKKLVASASRAVVLQYLLRPQFKKRPADINQTAMMRFSQLAWLTPCSAVGASAPMLCQCTFAPSSMENMASPNVMGWR
ncbi:MAG: hypothetical protein CTY12_03220 [Methylotenera sp.]|nr:MAG: hypothetical protein CTY12_03220 [Methylotenera sp.]